MVKLFIRSAGVLLIITAIAKLTSSAGSASILQTSDPILSTSFKHIFWFIGAVELVVASICLFSKKLALQATFVAWLATSILLYRLGLVWVGYHKGCQCLGNLTDILHISPQIADTAMKIILAYLLLGSYATLFWLWRQHKKAVSSTVGTSSL